MITQEDMEEMRRDMLAEDRREVLLEMALYKDDDVLLNHLNLQYGDSIRGLVAEIEHYRESSDISEWIEDLL